MISRIAFTLTALVGGLAIAGAAVGGEWTHERGGPDSLNRTDGIGDMSSALDSLPGIAWSVDLLKLALPSPELIDLDEDGLAEVVFPYRGAVGAYHVGQGAFRWVSASVQADAVIGLADLDGDGARDELLATSNAPRGGLYVFDASGGGLIGSVTGFEQLSGIQASEVVVYDLDGDGADEVVLPAGLYGLGRMWVVDFPTDLSAPALVTLSFEGNNQLTFPRVGPILPGAEPGIALLKGRDYEIWGMCAAGDPGASCDDGPGTFCICGRGEIPGVHHTTGFGLPRMADVDGDGTTESIEIHSHFAEERSLGVVDFSRGLDTGNPADSILWYRDYEVATPTTRIYSPDQELVDFDGDGNLDLVVSFVNNDGSDRDHALNPADDGIDHPGGVAMAVFDATTGEVKAFQLDTWAHGYADIDGDGDPEIITSPAIAWTWQAGLTAYRFICTGGPCRFEQVWTSPGRALHPDLASLDNVSHPTGGVRLVDADQDGDPELLAYNGPVLQVLDVSGGPNAVIIGSAGLLGEESVRVSDLQSGQILTADDSQMRILSADLSLLGGPHKIPAQGSSRWYAAALEAGGRAVPVFEGRIYATREEPDSAAQADWLTFPRFAMIQDLDGDGTPEFISTRRASDGLGPGEEIRVDAYDPDTDSFETRWSFNTEGDPVWGGAAIIEQRHLTVGNFDGEGALDVAFLTLLARDRHVVILDGDTGEVETSFIPAQPPATSSQILAVDLASPDGSWAPDGIDDLVIPGPRRTQVWVLGMESALMSATTAFWHELSAHVDLDGDGERELVSTLNTLDTNPIEATSYVGGTVTTLWGPNFAGLSTGHRQVLSFAGIDGVEGPDALYLSASDGLRAFSGLTGSELDGFPVAFRAGELVDPTTDGVEIPSALLVTDIDGDGHDEAIVGSTSGWLYAVDIEQEEVAGPGLVWSFQLGAGVEALSAADVDGDGLNELLLSTADGRGSVLDSLGVALRITSPDEGICIGVSEPSVRGESSAVATVSLSVSGVAGTQDIDASSGTWEGRVSIPGPGIHVIRAEGYDGSGQAVAVATRSIFLDSDSDQDGVTACGGDCDDEDALRNPFVVEICGDGIDQDCDEVDPDCPPLGDDDDDDDDSSGDDGGGCEGCDCESSLSAAQGGPSAALLAILLTAWIGRRRRV